jgi:NAD(P)-dependent dehydrogenase (short-subunit alcohol dehydrogenase family)
MFTAMKHWQDYTPAPDLLRERVILVTGAGDGIGRAAARAFGAHGATVILLGRTIAKLEQVYDSIQQSGGPQPAIYPMNLLGATVKDYEDLALTLEQQFGRLDGLLHNAAMLGTLTPFGLYDPEMWQQVMQVNMHAPFLLTRACLDLLKRAVDASLIFTSSSQGRRGRAYWGAYAVSQFAVEGMMQVLADELDNTSVRVNSLNPGAVRTTMRANAYPGEDPAGLAAPEDIMRGYLYLMGPDSKGIHGQALDAQ